jgi:hypothetical protein
MYAYTYACACMGHEENLCDEKKEKKKTSRKQQIKPQYAYRAQAGPTRRSPRHPVTPAQSLLSRSRSTRGQRAGRPRDSDGPAASPIRHPTAGTALPDLSAPRAGRPPGARPRKPFVLIRAVRPETDPVCPRGGEHGPPRHHAFPSRFVLSRIAPRRFLVSGQRASDYSIACQAPRVQLLLSNSVRWRGAFVTSEKK